MYIIDFMKSTIRKANIPVYMYLFVNITIIAVLTENTFKTEWITAFMFGLVIYMLSLAIALSPIGETILRLQTGCRRIRRKDYADYINPIFNEVYEEVKKKNPTISSKVQLFISNDDGLNAFATGRKTICITKGMLQAPTDEIKAVLGHEFGHIAHKDTDLILIVSIGNFIVTSIFVCIRMFARIISFIGQLVGFFAGEIALNLGAFLSGFLVDVILVLFMRFWTKFGMLLVMKSSRSNEYEADQFSFELGYGESLCRFLDRFDACGFDGLFASLMSSHPDADLRIARLQELGVKYYLQRD